VATTERASPYIPISSGEFRAVIGATLFIMLGFGLIIPALPQFAKQLGVGDAGLSFILSAFAFTRLVGNFFPSQLIARFGERKMAGAGAAIVGLSSIAAGMSLCTEASFHPAGSTAPSCSSRLLPATVSSISVCSQSGMPSSSAAYSFTPR